jgi:hypothetical protein
MPGRIYRNNIPSGRLSWQQRDASAQSLKRHPSRWFSRQEATAMIRTTLLSASVATLLATGVMAQTAAPAPQQPAAPAQAQPMRPAAPANAAIGAQQLTTSKIVGISIYAPKPDQASTATTAPMTTGSTVAPAAAQMTVTPVSDEQWRTMRDRHDSIGKIDDLVIGADGRITHAVLGVGGFLGIGEKNVALSLPDIKFMRMADGTLVGFVTSTKKQLQDMPAFTPART